MKHLVDISGDTSNKQSNENKEEMNIDNDILTTKTIKHISGKLPMLEEKYSKENVLVNKDLVKKDAVKEGID